MYYSYDFEPVPMRDYSVRLSKIKIIGVVLIGISSSVRSGYCHARVHAGVTPTVPLNQNPARFAIFALHENISSILMLFALIS